MELTNQQAQDALAVLRNMGQQKYPAKFAWKLQTARRHLEPFQEALIEAIQGIQQKYAERDDDGNIVPGKNEQGEPLPGTIVIPPKDLAAANQELEELLAETITVENVKLRIFDFPDSVEVTPDMLSALAPIMTD
jgi:hypothetical protein